MDIKLTLDISDRLDAALSRIADVIQAVTIQTAPAAPSDPVEYCLNISDAPAAAAYESTVDAKDILGVCEPVPVSENVAEKHVEAESDVPDEPAPVETPKPRRGRPPKAHAPENSSPAPAAEPETPEIDIDSVRAVCVKAAKSGKTKVVTDYLAAHNAASLTKLDPSRYGELIKTVQAAL